MVIQKLTQVLAYLRTDTKRKKKDKAEEAQREKVAAQSIYEDVAEYVPDYDKRKESSKKDRDYFEKPADDDVRVNLLIRFLSVFDFRIAEFQRKSRRQERDRDREKARDSRRRERDYDRDKDRDRGRDRGRKHEVHLVAPLYSLLHKSFLY